MQRYLYLMKVNKTMKLLENKFQTKCNTILDKFLEFYNIKKWITKQNSEVSRSLRYHFDVRNKGKDGELHN